MRVLINDVDFTDNVDLTSLEIQDAISERSTVGFTFTDVDNMHVSTLAPGVSVQMIHDGTMIFGGTIDRVTQSRPIPSTQSRQYRVECVDWHQVCDRRIVAETYQNTRAGEIARDIVRKYLAVDGIVCQNLCPVFEFWTLANGATLDAQGVLRFSDMSSYAESSFIRIDGAANWWFTADCFPESGAGSDKLLTSYYYDASFRPVANSVGHTSDEHACDSPAGDWDRYSWVGVGGPDVAYIKIRIQRDATYAPNPYQVRKPMLSVDEITVDPVQDGPVVVEAVFNYVSATTCLDTLSERAGYSWWIDTDRTLYFCNRASYASPWAIDSSDEVVNNLRVERNREDYRNRQYIRAGKDMTDVQTEDFKGNGTSRTFTVGFPVAEISSVTINEVPKTIGIKGVDEGRDWYWNRGDAAITQDRDGPILGDTDVLSISYRGFFDVVVLTTDENAIDERKSTEGGSGWYEAVDDEPYLSSKDAALQSANARLRRYSKLNKILTFDTWHPGLRPGQILSVNLPGRGLHNEEFLINEVVFSCIGNGYWQYDVRAVSGESLGGWTRFFKAMAERGQAFVIRENIREDQVLIRLVQSQENWTWTETTPVTVNACPIPSVNLYPSTMLYPC